MRQKITEHNNIPAVQGMAILNRRLDALKAFQERQTAGLNLSDRVWKYTDCFKQEIELGLSAGIEPGQPAADIARSLTQYLQHPDKLFRRVRDQYGNLQLSKAAAAFHPGRGVYRSSYKNARRLAATETNMAYRTADHQRWKAAPYVVGIRISLSHNHTCLDRNGVPQDFTDICDELAGDYPKTFHFTGWHPHCRCTATAILKTQDEIEEDTRRILNGEDPTDPDTSHNHIPNLPKNFTDWQERNAARIASSHTPPEWAKYEANEIKANSNQHGDEDEARGTGSFCVTTQIEAENILHELAKKNDKEEAYVFLTDGRIYHKTGSQTRVCFTGEEREMFNGADLIHNHPFNECLTQTDILFAINNHLASITAIGAHRKCKAVIPSNTKRIKVEDFKIIVNEVEDKVIKEMATKNSIEYDKFRRDPLPHFINALSKRLGIRFSISDANQ